MAADIDAVMSTAAASPLAADCPRVEDGARGVRFIEATVASSRSSEKWWPLIE